MSVYDPREKIRAMLPTASGTYAFSANDAVALMVFTRELLEATSAKTTHPILNLFCNWTVHTELEGSRPGYELLRTASEILLDTADQVEREKRISAAISSAQLRAQLIALFSANGLTTHLWDAVAGWEMFGGQFFKALMHKRIRFPRNPDQHKTAGSIYGAMRSRAGDRWPEAAMSMRLRNDYTEYPNRIRWCIERADGSEIHGQYLNLEATSDFSQISFRRHGIALVPASNGGAA